MSTRLQSDQGQKRRGNEKHGKGEQGEQEKRRKGAQKMALKMLEEKSRPDNPWMRSRLDR